MKQEPSKYPFSELLKHKGYKRSRASRLIRFHQAENRRIHILPKAVQISCSPENLEFQLVFFRVLILHFLSMKIL